MICKYSINGTDSLGTIVDNGAYNYTDSSGFKATAGTKEKPLWRRAKLTPSDNLNNIYTLQLHFMNKYADDDDIDTDTVPDPYFMINDISIIYRNKGIK